MTFISFFNGLSICSSVSEQIKKNNRLLQAINERNVDEVNEAIKDGGSVNGLTGNGDSMLMAACFLENEDSIEIVNKLIEEKADVNFVTSKGKTVLNNITWGCQYRNGGYEFIKILLNAGANINHQHDRYGSLLHSICLTGDASWNKSLKLLIDRNADINAVTNEGKSPLFLALENYIKSSWISVSNIKILLDAGADMDNVSNDGTNIQQLLTKSPEATKLFEKEKKKRLEEQKTILTVNEFLCDVPQMPEDVANIITDYMLRFKIKK